MAFVFNCTVLYCAVIIRAKWLGVFGLTAQEKPIDEFVFFYAHYALK
jgi:hypothetical protein